MYPHWLALNLDWMERLDLAPRDPCGSAILGPGAPSAFGLDTARASLRAEMAGIARNVS